MPKVSKIPYDLFSLSRMLPLLSHHCNVFVSLLKEKKRRRKRQRKRRRKRQRKEGGRDREKEGVRDIEKEGGRDRGKDAGRGG